MNGIERIITKEKFIIQIGDQIVATRLQYPLDLCWALSVHKAQGMTLNNVELNLKHAFEYGQTYVALSRVQNSEGLKLMAPLLKEHIKVHPDVLEFYNELETIHSII